MNAQLLIINLTNLIMKVDNITAVLNSFVKDLDIPVTRGVKWPK
jgi:hypothetical protein